jgi:hypothetical protein
MESGFKIVEAILYRLLPPACREEILGDMRERNPASAQLLMEAVTTVPSVIYSRILRTTDAAVALMEAVFLYTAFVLSAWRLNHEQFIRQYGFVRLAIPPAIFMAAIVLGDAYSDPKKRWPLKPLLAPTLGFALAGLVELNHRWALPVSVLAWGGALGYLFVSTLRVIFPPIAERPQTIKVPLFWQKLELSGPSFILLSVLLPCAVLLVIYLYSVLSRL